MFIGGPVWLPPAMPAVPPALQPLGAKLMAPQPSASAPGRHPHGPTQNIHNVGGLTKCLLTNDAAGLKILNISLWFQIPKKCCTEGGAPGHAMGGIPGPAQPKGVLTQHAHAHTPTYTYTPHAKALRTSQLHNVPHRRTPVVGTFCSFSRLWCKGWVYHIDSL